MVVSGGSGKRASFLPPPDWFSLHLTTSFIRPPPSSVRRGKVFILEQGVGVARRYRGVTGRITPSFCLFLPSLHNFRRWCEPRRGKVDNRLPGAKTPVLCTPIFTLYSNTFTLLPPTPRAHALVWRNYTLSSRLLHCSRVTSYGHDIQRRERYPYIPHHKV